MNSETSAAITFSSIGVAIVIALAVFAIMANTAWAPQYAAIRLEEIRLQTACIQQGGIPEYRLNCIWSRTPLPNA